MNLVERLDKWIFWCLCGFALMVCINAAIADFFTGVAVFFTIIRFIKKVPGINIPKEYLLAIGIFLGFFFILLFLNDQILISLKVYWRYLNRMIPLFVIISIINEKKKIIIISLFLFGGMTINNIAAIYKGVYLILEQYTYIRTSGFDNNIIGLAGELLIYIPILGILAFDKAKGRFHIYVYVGLFIGIVAFLLNGTRMAWLIMLILLPYMLYEKNVNVRKIGVFLILLFFSLGIISYNVPAIQNRISSITSKQDTSNQGHFFIVKDSIEMIKDAPLLGVGLGNFKEVFNEKYISEKTKVLQPKGVNHAHNTIVTIGAETGIIGVSAFCFMFGSFLFYSWQGWKKEKKDVDLMFFIITLAHLLQGLTDFSFGLHQTMKIYFCLLGLYIQYRYNDIERMKS